MNSGIEKSAKRHAALHQVFAVETELVGIVVRVGREHRGDGAARLHAPHQIVVDQRAVSDLRARVGSREQLLRALDGGQHHVDGHVAIGVAVDLDARAMHPLDPGIQIVLRLGDVALVRRLTPGYGLLSAMVRSENDPSTVCSEVAPKRIHSSPKPLMMPAVIIDSSTLPLDS